MGKRLGAGDYQYEAVEGWARIPIPGIASDVATDSEDRVYVATRTAATFDNYSGAILVFDRHGKFLGAFGGDKLRTPHHIWISPDDEIYHTDNFDHAVRRYSPAGELLQVIGTPGQPGIPGGPFNQPTCAVRSPRSGDVFVSDGYRQSRVHRFSYDGELELSWGKGDLNMYDQEVWHSEATAGTGPGEFNLPHSVTVGDDDRVYVMDRSNNRIQLFDENGEYLEQWETPSPNQAVVDGSVMHVASGRGVSILDLNGNPVGEWGERGAEPWQFAGSPHGLCIDSHGDLYVAQVGAEDALNKFARV